MGEPVTNVEFGRRLGYLLKHGFHELEAISDAALADLNLDSRELGVLIRITESTAASQNEIAQRMGIDRTSMVALLDQLEVKGIVVRRPDPADRRRNVIELTSDGAATVRRAITLSDEAERRYLADLDPSEIEQLRGLLVRVVSPRRD